MSERLTSVKNVVRLIKVCGRLTSTWPLDPKSSRRNQIIGELYWWMSFLNVIFLIVPLLLGVYHYRRDITVLMKALSELTALIEVFFNLVICKFQRHRLQHQPILVVSQFLLFVVCGLLRLYLTAWPADDLAEMSNKLGAITYSTRWVDGSMKMRKGILFVIQRSQKPLVISVTGILPALTLEFYASFVSATMSYFVTLRAVIDE